MRKTSEYELGTSGRRIPAAIFLPSSSFLRLVLPPREKERWLDRQGAGKDAQVPWQQNGCSLSAAKERKGNNNENKQTNKSEVVSEQGQMLAYGVRSGVPHNHFLPHSNPLYPHNVEASPPPPAPRPSRRAKGAFEEKGKSHYTVIQLTSPAPSQEVPNPQKLKMEKIAAAPTKHEGKLILTSYSTHSTSTP